MYHKSVKLIKEILDSNNVWYETFEHEPVRTSEEAANIRDGYTLEQGAKALIVKVKDIEKIYFCMLVFPANLKFNTKKVKNILQAKDIRFATEEEVNTVTEGIQLGGVHPFGNIYNIKVLVDEKLFLNEKMIFNAGDRGFSIAMFTQDYKSITNPLIKDIT